MRWTAPAAGRPFSLPDGRQVLIRPARAEDARSVAEAMRTASSATLRHFELTLAPAG